MLADWAIEPELGPSDTPLMKLAHEIVGLYKEVYYARQCAEANRAVDTIAAEQSLTAEREARGKLAADLASQQASWAAEQAVLLRDKDAAEHELQLARRQAMDAALLLKEAIELNSQIRQDLRIWTEQVYELRRQHHTSGTPPPSC